MILVTQMTSTLFTAVASPREHDVPARQSTAYPAVFDNGLDVKVCPNLAPQEREVLRLIAAGCTYGQTARRMGISPRTVETYLGRIRTKYALATRAEIVLLAHQLGLT
jgi:DNA-binding CsgD family transcriptional regulator